MEKEIATGGLYGSMMLSIKTSHSIGNSPLGFSGALFLGCFGASKQACENEKNLSPTGPSLERQLDRPVKSIAGPHAPSPTFSSFLKKLFDFIHLSSQSEQVRLSVEQGL